MTRPTTSVWTRMLCAAACAAAVVMATGRGSLAQQSSPASQAPGAAPTNVDYSFPLAADSPTGRPTTPQPRVLILSSYEPYIPSAGYQEYGIRKTLAKDMPFLSIRSDYLLPVQYTGRTLTPEERQTLAAELRRRHADRRPNLLIVIDTLAVDLLTHEAKGVFEGVPTVYTGLVGSAERAAGLNATGVLERIEPRRTIELIRQLQPDVRVVLFAAREIDTVAPQRAMVEKDLAGPPLGVDIRWTKATTLDELTAEVDALPPGTQSAVVAMSFIAPGVPPDAAYRWISRLPRPVYATYASQVLEKTLVGGCVVDGEAEGRAAGLLAMRLLRGERPADIQPESGGGLVMLVNHGAMRRWGIPESRIPDGAMVRGAPERWYIRYRQLLTWGSVAVLLQTLVIALLLLQRAGRRRAEAESQARGTLLEVIADTLPVYMSYVDAQGRYVWVNRKYEEWFGRPRSEIIGRPVREVQTAGAYERMQPHMQRAMAGERVEYTARVPGPDEGETVFEVLYVPRTGPHGERQGFFTLVVDATERQASQVALRESERRLRLALEASGAGMWSYDPRTKTATWDDRYHEIYGLGPGDARSYEQWIASAHPEDVPRVSARINEMLATPGDDDWRMEFRVVRPDGRVVWMLGLGKAERDAKGKVVRMSGLNLDITERKRTEQLLRESEAKHRRIVETAAEGIWLVDAAWYTTFVNAAMARMIGYTPEEMLGRHLMDFMDGRAREDCLRNMRRREEGRAEQHEFRLTHKDGRDVWTVMSTNSVLDEAGGFAGALAMVTDVTARRAAEASAREAEERFRATFEHAAVAIALVDMSGRYLMVNERFVQMMGYERDELMGMRFAELTHPEDVAVSVRQYRDAVEGRADVYSLEKRYIRKDGTVVWAIVTPSLVRDGEGRSSYFVGILQDITERKRTEEQLGESRRLLEQAQRVGRIGSWVSEAGPDGLLAWSDEVYRIFGVTRETFHVGLDSFYSLVHPEDRDLVQRASQAAMAAGGEFSIDHRIVRPDGEVRWVHEQAELEPDPHGRGVRMIGVVQDITERKLAEQAVLESEESYRALLGAIPDLMFRMDRGGNYLDYHAPDPSRLVAPPEQFLGRNVREVFTGALQDRAEMCVRALDALFATGTPQMYEYESRRDKRRTWWEVRVVQGRPGEALLLLRDVTARKRAEIRLRESEQRLRLLVENTPLAVVYWDLEFRVSAWNPGAERVFGFRADEALGKDVGFIVPADEQKYVGEICRALLAQKGGQRGTNRNVRKDGTIIFCEWYNSPLIDGSGRVIGVASVAEDVTERRRAQQRQSLMMAELDHRVKNNLATVISLAEQTGRGSSSYEEFVRTFTGRLRALSRMHSVLARSRWQGADLGTLVTQTLEAFGSESAGRASVAGPGVTLGPRTAQAVAMALNELATNAVKYGALSDERGTVRVDWWIEDGAAVRPTVHLRWTERGGPPVRAPERRGFGSDLIEGTIPFELKGRATLRFEAEGVVCEMEVPLEEEAPAARTGGGGSEALWQAEDGA